MQRSLKMKSAAPGGPRGTAGKSKATSGERADEHSISGAANDTPASGGSSKLVFGLNPRAHRSVPSKRQEAAVEVVATRQIESAAGLRSGQQPNGVSTTTASQEATARSSSSSGASKGHIRASKYGNFYKPQDLTTPAAAEAASKGAPATGAKAAMTATTKMTNEKSPPSNGGGSSSSGERVREKVVKQSAPSVDQKAAATSSAPSKSVRARSRSPDTRPAESRARRKSFDEDMSTIKIETPAAATATNTAGATAAQQPVLRPRTQFNILPPPQMSIATTGKGSVVDYAKSRIYDKPARPILANPPAPLLPECSALDDQLGGCVPASIQSGFKPPKQVNVSKAREKWEGGEPFAKCKSRKRLANAQANKKLFPGTWSMTSVVATQQLHLQQAQAQFASASFRSGDRASSAGALLAADPSVKVLSRGSVLERIQQYERAPGAVPLSTSSSLDSFFLDEEDERAINALVLSRSASSISSTLSLGSAGGETLDKPQVGGGGGGGGGDRDKQLESQLPTVTHQQRRPSLRRRSSLGLGPLRKTSTQSLIPKFYHPNGKPNTYEIELQKRNIEACFDKFPERTAQLAVPPRPSVPGTGNSNNNNNNNNNSNGAAAATAAQATARRQFHQIAVACGLSEYFKVPLQLYVKYQLETSPQLASAGQAAARAARLQRKSSTVALNTNSLGSAAPRSPLLVKSASIDLSPKKSGAASERGDGGEDGGKKTTETISSVTCDQFLACWRQLIARAFDAPAQFVHLLTFGQRNYLQPEDFVPLVQSVIDDHPGLKFLRAAPDFHMRYIQTVIARIYYCVNRSWTGKLTLQELRKSNLLAVLQRMSREEDINQVTDYFSYEHFYVIYCKFWNLDQDHDLFISKDDLARHNDAAISSRIIERIFAGIVSRQIAKTGKMSYSDFVWFLIAEEDKKHPRSIEYWFRLMDLDGDGYISMYEMEYFYYEQKKRLELMGIEPLPFLDSACQILDLVNPREKNKISLADLKRTKMATIFFDTFINLEKYLEHESREFVSTRDIVQNGVVVSDWDRYASEEYESLVTEETPV